MGYDITFHAISIEEFNYFVFDVIKDQDVTKSRINEITKDQKKQESLQVIYQNIIEFIQKKEPETNFSEGLNYLTAMLSGFLHPYWYARGCSFSLTIPNLVKGLFKPMKMLVKPYLQDITDDSEGLITNNFSASGISYGKDFDLLVSLFGALQKPNDFSEEVINAINNVFDYAQKNNLGILEATDIVVPIMGICNSDFTKLVNKF